MYAVVEIAGKQFTVTPREKIAVPSLKHQPGAVVKFDRVLLLGDEKSITVGNPLVQGAKVEATVVGHGKEDTVLVFKKKKRKGYAVRRGHRQGFTTVEITNIAS